METADPAGDPAGRQECVPPEWTANHRSSATATVGSSSISTGSTTASSSWTSGCHLEYLDGFGETGSLQEEYRAAFGRFAVLRREIAALQMDEAEKARRIDSLEFQIAELERAGLKAGEEEALTERRNCCAMRAS